MSEKKPVDPEFEVFDKPGRVKKEDKWTILWMFRRVFGHVYDSSGRRNNILMLLYAFSIAGIVSLVGSVFYKKADYNITITCVDKETGKKDRGSRTLRSKSNSKNKTNAVVYCGGSPIYINADLKPANPLPPSFYYVIFGFVVFLGTLYAARHEQMRSWMIKLVSSFKGTGGGVSSEEIVAKLQEAGSTLMGDKKDEAEAVKFADATKTGKVEPKAEYKIEEGDI